MQITFRGKNLDVTPALKEHATKRLGKLNRYFEQSLNAQVSLEVERGQHIVEVTIPVSGLILRGEMTSTDMYASLDQVIDKLERQVRKYKTRINRKPRTNGTVTAVLEPAADIDDDLEDGPRLVKTKRFAIKPMDPEEAIMQMNLVGHDFFVFVNAESDEVNVVYRRRDGDYGLIEPSR
jgi:putative sigma-54 modulation protein